MRLLTLLADLALPPRESEALVRDASFEQLADELSPVCRGERGLTCVSLFPYTVPLVEACIVESKFHDNQRAAVLLGSALREFLFEFLAEASLFEVLPPAIVPIPLSKARQKERGYNQVERVLSLALSQMRAELCIDLLIRTRETMPQTSLHGSGRAANVRGAFAASRPCNPNRTYIVVDDVITTGHTMAAACAVLRAGGAERLLPLTFAY